MEEFWFYFAGGGFFVKSPSRALPKTGTQNGLLHQRKYLCVAVEKEG